MANLQSGLASNIIGVQFTGDGPALLAGEPVSIQHQGPGFLGDRPLEGGNWFGSFEDVFARFQVTEIIVSEDLIAFFIAKFTDAPPPFRDVSRNLAQFVGRHFPANIFQEMNAQASACTQGFCHFSIRTLVPGQILGPFQPGGLHV